ncbi:MAG: hypothetical protein MUC79_10970 [Thiobacillaceae bacterium]|nr:hypothetical protein [Thiobacillaceae bacterium]
MANIIKSVANYIAKNPETEEAALLRELCQVLEAGGQFELGRLYDMKRKAFELAVELIEEWRFERHVQTRRLDNYLEKEKEQEKEKDKEKLKQKDKT